MSWRASQYARDLLESGQVADLTVGDRLVLMITAERANKDRAETYSGQWLVDACGMHPSSVRRCLYRLADTGAVALQFRPGKATVIRFPLAAVLSTPRADESSVGGQIRHIDPAPTSATPRADERDTPRPWASRTNPQPSVYQPAELCSVGGCPCDGTGWTYHQGPGSERGYVQPCPGREGPTASAAQKATGS